MTAVVSIAAHCVWSTVVPVCQDYEHCTCQQEELQSVYITTCKAKRSIARGLPEILKGMPIGAA